jgi:hypothetical protein
MDRSKVESIDRVDRQWMWIDRTSRLDRFRGLLQNETELSYRISYWSQLLLYDFLYDILQENGR